MALAHALIFDLDGTLLDSLRDIGESMNVALARRGFPTHDIESYRKKVGEGVDVLVKRSVPPDANIDIAQFVAEYRSDYAARGHITTQPFPGVMELLAELTKRRVPMAVLSNKRDDFTKELVRLRFPNVPFRTVRGETEGVPRKPDPTAPHECALELGVSAAFIGFVGDTQEDVKAARNSGMTPIGVTWGFRTREEMAEHGCKLFIDRAEELLQHVVTNAGGK